MKHLEDTPWWICDPEDTNYCTYSDTDSIYMHAEPILRHKHNNCLLYTSPSPRDRQKSRMPSSA